MESEKEKTIMQNNNIKMIFPGSVGTVMQRSEIRTNSPGSGANVLSSSTDAPVNNAAPQDGCTAQQHIAENLRLLRHLKGISQEDAAARLCISRSCYACFENGSRLPDLATAQKIADTFEITLEHLLLFDISKHVLFLLKTDHGEMDSCTFAVNYLRLSETAKEYISDKVTGLAAMESAFHVFPHSP